MKKSSTSLGYGERSICCLPGTGSRTLPGYIGTMNGLEDDWGAGSTITAHKKGPTMTFTGNNLLAFALVTGTAGALAAEEKKMLFAFDTPDAAAGRTGSEKGQAQPAVGG